MRTRFHIGIVFVVLCFFSVLFISLRNTSHALCPDYVVTEANYHVPLYLQNIDTQIDTELVVLQNTLKNQRNELSKDLNRLRQQLGKQDCEKEQNKETNSAGGWCLQSSREDGGQHMTDMPLVKGLSEFLKGKTVGSFGDGPGAYKRELTGLHEIKLYDAYDGAPYCNETSNGLVQFLDLTVPQYGIPMYDWVISLEVAEHIPKEHEAVYIDNLVRHSREGIIMSWAVPGQGGLAHINNRPLSYVIKLMDFHGFKHDASTSQHLKLKASFAWLRDNLNVFWKDNVNHTNLNFIEEWYT